MIINAYNNISNRGLFRSIIKFQRLQEYVGRRNTIKYHREYIETLKEVELFSSIQIETINRCNGECTFCPVNKNDDNRPFAIMTDELFGKVINELSEHNYSGEIALYSNNEPLLDVKLESRIEKARLKCPNAHLYIYTNGTLLTAEKYLSLVQLLDEIVIDNYNDELKLNENLIPIAKLCENNTELNEKTKIYIRKQNEILTTRAGQSPNKKIKKHEIILVHFRISRLLFVLTVK